MDRLPTGPSGLIPRGIALLLGLGLLAAGAFAVVQVVRGNLDPQPGAQATVTERVDYWTPHEGDQQVLRPRRTQVRDTAEGLEVLHRLDGAHSPRGDRFPLEVTDRYRLEAEPGGFARFPPTALWEEPPETVHLAVPWATDDGVRLGPFDTFQRLHEVERAGVTLVEYQAREPNQFLVDGDTVWFRNADRTAFVEPVSGTVVDYRSHETIWRAPLDRPDLLHDLEPPRENREKVWEATARPTDAATVARAEQARDRRSDHWSDVLLAGLPLLGAGEALLWAGLAGRPRRLMGGSS